MKKKLTYTQFFKLLIEIIQFKIIFYILQWTAIIVRKTVIDKKTAFYICQSKKNWKTSDKKRVWATCITFFNIIQELTSINITIDENKSKEINIFLSLIKNYTIKAL